MPGYLGPGSAAHHFVLRCARDDSRDACEAYAIACRKRGEVEQVARLFLREQPVARHRAAGMTAAGESRPSAYAALGRGDGDSTSEGAYRSGREGSGWAAASLAAFSTR